MSGPSRAEVRRAQTISPRVRWAKRWLPVLGWMALIFVLSAQPGLRISDDAAVDSPVRAVAHVLTFAVLGALLFRALMGSLSMPGAAIAAFVGATLYGVSDEIHQALVPDRTGQIDDVVLDAAGAAVGVVVAVLASRAIRRRRMSPVDAPSDAAARDRR